MAKGLIIKGEWLDKIFDSDKRWEMRSSNTSYRGVVKLIQAGTGLIVGEAVLTDSFKVDAETAKLARYLHQVDDLSLLEKWCWAWSFTGAVRYDEPIPYKHPQGAVIWVNLEER